MKNTRLIQKKAEKREQGKQTKKDATNSKQPARFSQSLFPSALFPPEPDVIFKRQCRVLSEPQPV